jgi:hypothetical protein
MTAALIALAALYPLTVAVLVLAILRAADGARGERAGLVEAMTAELAALREERPALLDRIQAPGAIAAGLYPDRPAVHIPTDDEIDDAWARSPESAIPVPADLAGLIEIEEE